jgi:hypothetical protein
MSIRVKSNAGPKLTEWERLMKTAPKALAEMSQAMAEETVTLISDGFRSETDPYGDRWKPKQARDGRKTLSGKTSRLKRWQVERANKGGFRVSPTVNYAAPHQSPRPRPEWGGKALPRRMMIPSAERGLPRAWSRAYTEIGISVLSDHFSKRGGKGMSFISSTKAGLKRRFNWKALARKAVGAISGE